MIVFDDDWAIDLRHYFQEHIFIRRLAMILLFETPQSRRTILSITCLLSLPLISLPFDDGLHIYHEIYIIAAFSFIFFMPRTAGMPGDSLIIIKHFRLGYLPIIFAIYNRFSIFFEAII